MMVLTAKELDKAHAIMKRMTDHVEAHELPCDVLPLLIAGLLFAVSSGKTAGTDIDSMHVVLDFVWAHAELEH